MGHGFHITKVRDDTELPSWYPKCLLESSTALSGCSIHSVSRASPLPWSVLLTLFSSHLLPYPREQASHHSAVPPWSPLAGHILAWNSNKEKARSEKRMRGHLSVAGRREKRPPEVGPPLPFTSRRGKLSRKHLQLLCVTGKG